MTGQHDQQDEMLTGQLPNQSGYCLLTSHYFEPYRCKFIEFLFFKKGFTEQIIIFPGNEYFLVDSAPGI